MSWLTDPFLDGIGRRALLEVTLLGLAGGALGVWVLFYELAYPAESLAHSLLPGLVLASLVGFPLLLGGAAGLLVAALAVVLAGRIEGIGRDAAVAVVITGLFGLGVLLALSPESPAGLQGLLFGDVLGVSDTDLLLAGGLVLLLLLALRLLHTRLLIVGFDRAGSAALGVRASAIDAVLLVLLALTLLVAVQGLGNLLVVALLIGPASAARLLTRRIGPLLVVSATVAVLAGVAGIYASYHARTAAGASIAVALVASYGLAALARPLVMRS